MSDDVDQENPDLTVKERETQMIERITAAVIAVMRAANLAGTLTTADSAATDVNNEFSKQFKSKNIEFFDSELSIKKDTIIIDDKL